MRQYLSQIFGFVLWCGIASAESRCVGVKPPRSAYGESIALVPTTKGITSVVEGAIELWRGCQRQGAGMPALFLGEGGGRDIEVVYVAGSSAVGAAGPSRGKQ